MSDLPQIKIGYIHNSFDGKLVHNVALKHNSVSIKYPTRLNADGLDLSNFVQNKKRIYPVGEILVSINKFINVATKYLGNNDGILDISKSTKRKVLVNHAYKLMCTALNISPSLHININDDEVLKHCGLGSTGAIIGAVCCSINELYGKPMKDLDIIKYVMSNYGEEIDDDSENLIVIPSMGGSIATGMAKGGIMVIAGNGVPIGTTNYNGKIIIGVPNDYQPSSKLEDFNSHNIEQNSELEESKNISYCLVHEILPRLAYGDISALSKMIFKLRFMKGRIQKCSFVFPRINEIAANIKHLYKNDKCDMLSMSSTGPAFFALVSNENDEKECIKQFEKQDMMIITTSACNETYSVKKE
jgi:predicted sugar kinase